MTHPAKYNDGLLPEMARFLQGCETVCDIFAGTGKIGHLKRYGFKGVIYANEIEPEYLGDCAANGCDVITCADAEFLMLPKMDAICTSPTYGNRMADHHNAKDGTDRLTYTHCLGRRLSQGNTGELYFWNEGYKEKHLRIYKHVVSSILKDGGLFILNVKDFFRHNQFCNITLFHGQALQDSGIEIVNEIQVPCRGFMKGRNAKRTGYETILVGVKR